MNTVGKNLQLLAYVDGLPKEMQMVAARVHLLERQLEVHSAVLDPVRGEGASVPVALDVVECQLCTVQSALITTEAECDTCCGCFFTERQGVKGWGCCFAAPKAVFWIICRLSVDNQCAAS